MSSILTVRLEDEMKRQGTEAFRNLGLSPSAAVQKLFEYVVRHDRLPFETFELPSKEEILETVCILDSFHTKQPSGKTDDEIKNARFEERYGSGS